MSDGDAMTPLISRKKTVHGGVAVIAGTRIPVAVLVSYAFEPDGLNRAQRDYPQLSSKHIQAAWDYAATQLGRAGHGTPAKV